VLFAKKDYDRAIADYDQAIKLKPAVSTALINRRDAWRAKGMSERAAAEYGEAVRIDPDNALVYLNRALVYLKSGELDKAIAEVEPAARWRALRPRPCPASERQYRRRQRGHRCGEGDQPAHRRPVRNLQHAAPARGGTRDRSTADEPHASRSRGGAGSEPGARELRADGASACERDHHQRRRTTVGGRGAAAVTAHCGPVARGAAIEAAASPFI
jgi:TPR repeat/Tetratricopeptide repeat